MRKFNIIIFILMSICIGCQDNVININDMMLKQNKYFLKSNIDIPYTGVAISKYSEGTVSDKTSFVNGIPNGEWTSYGYENEVIQKGFYKPSFVGDKAIPSIGEIKRVNVCAIKEGEFKFSYIYIISNQHSIIFKKDSRQFAEVLLALKARGVAFDDYPVDTIIMSNGEIDL
jgi:hypothetical protein